MNLESLNKQQCKAVVEIGGPMLVFAGAGSGKTRVLTYKIAYLIEDAGLPPENILAVTFTNKASQEMKNRIKDLIKLDIEGITIGTFHSLGAMILRKHIHKIGYTNDFTIYDQSDSKALIKKIIKDLNLDLKMFDPKSIQIRISNSKNNMLSIREIENQINTFHDEKFLDIFKEYKKVLQDNNAVDFDDLLVLPLEIFGKYQDVLNFYQEKYQYILVDEYQDTNKPQFEIVSILSNKHKNIFVVGDDDQSIYGWRGAGISNILNFQSVFKNSKIIKLEQNYRSTQNILDAAWSVVSKNSERSEKKLWTENKEGSKINIIETFDEKDEAKKVVDEILNLSKDIKKDNFVILYRTNAQSRTIEDQLRRMGVPYQIVGGTKFYDRKEIKDIIAYLKFIINSKDSISFSRIINFPHRGIGKTTIDKIFACSKNNNFIEILLNPDVLNISIKQKETLNKMGLLFSKYRKKVDLESPISIVEELLSEIKIKEFYENNMTGESQDRLENINELITSIDDYSSHNINSKLFDYLEEVSLLTDIDKWNNQDDLITMMTIHSSKGLEFDYVYIVGLEDGLFPMIRGFDESDIQEERRLFYVALTRAEKVVNLTYAKTRRRFGSEINRYNKSRFLDEIPASLIKENNLSKFSNKVESFNNFYNQDIAINQFVEHKIFGKGKVINIEGNGSNAKITILFNNNERKKLIYKYANLKIIS